VAGEAANPIFGISGDDRGIIEAQHAVVRSGVGLMAGEAHDHVLACPYQFEGAGHGLNENCIPGHRRGDFIVGIVLILSTFRKNIVRGMPQESPACAVPPACGMKGAMASDAEGYRSL
jgi:hypothetical protein